MDLFDLSQVDVDRRAAGRSYREFLRVPPLSAGLYVLPAGTEDPQRPHREDELYYVVSGRGMVRVAGEDRPVAPGTVVFVPAGVEHRFHTIAEELRLLVVFGPAESS
jgi:mannose-6-phosphate isomerase-like protein (cupin superfamily)